jgi:release factor glutamine methyltransferase
MKINSLVTNNEWLKCATKKLLAAGIDSAQLDSLILLCFCRNLTKLEILSSPNQIVPRDDLYRADKFLAKRLLNYPVAYITKQVEFYGRTFYVDSRVLIPRPESESFINLLKSTDISGLRYLTDVGCGSGILGITAKLEFPNLNVELLDKSTSALKVANINKNNLLCKADIKLSNVLSESSHNFDIILANLPYVPIDMNINEPAKFEPKMAIFAPTNGLYFYELLVDQISGINKRPKYILIECLENQIELVTKLLNKISYKLERSDGLVHQFTY